MELELEHSSIPLPRSIEALALDISIRLLSADMLFYIYAKRRALELDEKKLKEEERKKIEQNNRFTQIHR